MKKYIAPEVEIKKFNVENIMAESGLSVTKTDGTAVSGTDVAAPNVDYKTLFEIN